ncbi:50S ribosomal protein L15 [Candidatus Bathyarchaeota archaeon ex4484_205]|nr:MAG: 50S ribosomal protein L15 [Candidatus Bathyarchaeota archaeon ex4484_205]RLG68770.1 MAG: 50S ribosomal protein L15 [archaeon]
MPHKLRKTRKYRGSRTHGYGQVGQHRKSGMKGGKGKAGTHKHKWNPPEPKYEGRYGFVRKPLRKKPRVINVGALDELASNLNNKKNKDGRTIIDLTKLGYVKLLGGGFVSNSYHIITLHSTKLATEKIEAAGGVVEVKEAS